MSGPIRAELERSLRRAPQRRRVLVQLSSLGETTVGQLARMCGLPWGRTMWICVGHPPQYSVVDSLVGSGMATLRRKGRAHIVAITPEGRRKVRSLLAFQHRAHVAREARRAAAVLPLVGAPTPGEPLKPVSEIGS